MSYEMTKAQKRVFDFVRRSIDVNGWPPTRGEISEALGFASANAAQEHLLVLEKKGFVELVPGISRGIRITKQ